MKALKKFRRKSEWYLYESDDYNRYEIYKSEVYPNVTITFYYDEGIEDSIGVLNRTTIEDMMHWDYVIDVEVRGSPKYTDIRWYL